MEKRRLTDLAIRKRIRRTTISIFTYVYNMDNST